MASGYWVALSVSASLVVGVILFTVFFHYYRKRKAQRVLRSVVVPGTVSPVPAVGTGPRGNIHTLSPPSTVGKPIIV